ncbi:MAG: ParB family transcriptional regulator, chromosome partitioning protein [Patescibacteria group bacterium]|nr:ParB family transcriptional regulator, chromosome partitioning protein [Patescibacteria group bacterium]
MSKPKGGLGRGLGSLIGPGAGSIPASAPVAQALAPVPAEESEKDSPETQVGDFSPEPVDTGEGDLRIQYVSPGAIRENSQQPRAYFDDEALSDLKASILEHGILQPLVVIESGKGKYELIAGERRLRAVRALGLESIPVIVRPHADEQQKLELALIENIQRQDLNAVEEARAYQALINEFGLRQEDIAGRVGKARSTITNALRLLELEKDVLDALADGRISRSHARTLLAEPVPSRRREIFAQMLSGNMTVRQAEAKAGVKNRKNAGAKDPNIAALEAELREKLGTKVVIEMQGGTGKVVVHFYSREDLKELIDRFTGRVS